MLLVISLLGSFGAKDVAEGFIFPSVFILLPKGVRLHELNGAVLEIITFSFLAGHLSFQFSIFPRQ